MILEKGLKELYNYRIDDLENEKTIKDDNVDASWKELIKCLDLIILNSNFPKSVIHYSKSIEEHISYLNNILSNKLWFFGEDRMNINGNLLFVRFKSLYELDFFSELGEAQKSVAIYVYEIVELILTRNIKEAIIYAKRRSKLFTKKRKGLAGKTFVCIINGSNQVGKDTFIDLFKQGSIETVHNISTVDKVKEAATILGWDGIKTDENREALHQLKLLGTRFFDHSVRYVREFVRKHTGSVIFVHCREPKEIERLVEEVIKVDSGVFCRTLLIKNNRVEPATNSADQNVLNYEYDDTIWNNETIEELEEKAKKYCYTFIY